MLRSDEVSMVVDLTCVLVIPAVVRMVKLVVGRVVAVLALPIERSFSSQSIRSQEIVRRFELVSLVRIQFVSESKALLSLLRLFSQILQNERPMITFVQLGLVDLFLYLSKMSLVSNNMRVH